MHDDPRQLFGISKDDWAKTPESVRLAVLSLLDIVQAQSTQIRELQTQVRELHAKVGQTSHNSSKPPASDPPSVPPRPPRTPRGRKAGGQLGHEGHQRAPVPPDHVDDVVPLRPDRCPSCQTSLAADLPDAAPVRTTQVWEVPPIMPVITEYQQHTICCPQCRQVVTADLPPTAPPGAFGPRLTALIGLVRGRYRFSERETAEFLTDVYGLPISTGSIVASCLRVSAALAPVDAAIQQVVQAQPQVNVDETSWRLPHRRGWLWTAVSPIATCFRLHASRGQPALRALLGDGYRGIVTSDRWTAYRLLPDRQRQLCWAHLIRNVVGLDEQYGKETGWARTVLGVVDDLFFAWRAYTDGWFDQIALQQALIPVRLAIRDALVAGVTSPWPKLASFSGEVLGHWDALWTFSCVAGIEPTNNAAERAVRPAVLWRKGCFGSRSDAGCRFVERMLSVRATCGQQGRSLFAFLTEAVLAAWAGAPAPVLVPAP